MQGVYQHKSQQGFQKGHKRLNSGRTLFKKGVLHTEEWKKKRRENSIGDKNHFYGKHHDKKAIEKMSLARKGKMCGENHPGWLGGKSFEPYGLEFNDDLKEVIRNRDRRKCSICGKTELEEGKRLQVHHIDYDKKNNNPDNLITLCSSCHCKTNFKRDNWLNYFK